MKPHFIILLIILSFIILTGCSQKCDDFDNSIVAWMPYTEGGKIVFLRNDKTDTLIVNSSVRNHTDKVGFRTDCMCVNSYSLNLSADSVNIDVSFHDSRRVEISDIIINDEGMGYFGIIDTLVIDGKTFTDLIEYKNTSHDVHRFERVILSKSIGIVSISGPFGEWKFPDYSKKNVDASGITYNSHDC
jgi:hypothetical protein